MIKNMKKANIQFRSGLEEIIENVLFLTQYEIYTSFFENTHFYCIIPVMIYIDTLPFASLSLQHCDASTLTALKCSFYSKYLIS